MKIAPLSPKMALIAIFSVFLTISNIYSQSPATSSAPPANNNIVFLGKVKTAATSAKATSLTATVPTGINGSSITPFQFENKIYFTTQINPIS